MERRMEIEIATVMHRTLIFGAGMIVGIILCWFMPHWFSRWARRFRSIAQGIFPGRNLRGIERRIDSLTERSTRMNSDIDDMKSLLVRLLDADTKKVATPHKNGIATPQ